MAKFKKIIDAQDGKPVFVNPDQIGAVFKYNDCEQTCVLLESESAMSNGFSIAVNAELVSVVEYLEDITDIIELEYFSDDTEQALVEENDAKPKLYMVKINCPTVKAVNCAVSVMARNNIIENTESARAEAVRDMSGTIIEDPSSYFIVKEDVERSEALELCNDFTNTTCINAKVEEM